ncbi:TPA: hypothetical protein DIV55_06400 [Patescibacteria group bacterium]|uniref:Uncharacterized protein n=1 Tax=Candidatus Gottesmanbacteria bacterium GW2011_GWA1_43_11 TaxID=1618436 RepID=A0A0G1F9Z2_9BACT|nr:MAG: hypothetical protein UV59_C0034G0004 [Candidatus Gottesmanbacteria bacterium GW2011_GWA1_43_11]HCS79337.1 hypothetical protein [Patescibacteria group bacterium]
MSPKNPEHNVVISAASADENFKSSIGSFISENSDFSIPSAIVEKSKDIKTRLDTARFWDVVTQIALRIGFSVFFGFLLFYQNIRVFGLVIDSIRNGSIRDLQIIIGVVISGTLIETYKISEIMVKWMFKDIDYKKY